MPCPAVCTSRGTAPCICWRSPRDPVVAFLRLHVTVSGIARRLECAAVRRTGGVVAANVVFVLGSAGGLSGGDVHALRLAEAWNEIGAGNRLALRTGAPPTVRRTRRTAGSHRERRSRRRCGPSFRVDRRPGMAGRPCSLASSPVQADRCVVAPGVRRRTCGCRTHRHRGAGHRVRVPPDRGQRPAAWAAQSQRTAPRSVLALDAPNDWSNNLGGQSRDPRSARQAWVLVVPPRPDHECVRPNRGDPREASHDATSAGVHRPTRGPEGHRRGRGPRPTSS